MRSKPIRTMAVAFATACALALAGCSSTDNGGKTGETDKPVTYATMPGQAPNWIGPFNPPDKMVTANTALHNVMWEPLFNFNGASGKMGWDKQGSAAADYKFSEDNKTIEITLGTALKWSDGEPVVARDVEFQYNLIRNNLDLWGSYKEGLFPDNVTDFTVIDDTHLKITFDKVYNSEWLVANQLTYLKPLPAHAWNKENASAEVTADLDRTEAGAKAIYQMLQDESKDVSGYASNEMWKLINGPYGVDAWTTDGAITLKANEKYTGADSPSIKTVKLMPYTSNDAEVNDVRAKGVDYGYITATELESEKQFTDLGYKIEPWAGWSVTYAPYNFANPTTGPIFSQLYVRQGLQHAIDQQTLSDKVWHGAAMPGYGPIPQNPTSDFLSDTQAKNPYPYDMSKAEKSFTDNGWAKGSDGILECTNPGTGSGQCGEGIAAGAKMKIKVMTENPQVTMNMWAAIKSSLSEIGVELSIESAPSEQVLTTAQECKAGTGCSWDLVFFGTAGSWYFSAYPTGDRLWAKDVKWNCGQYVDEKAFELISDTLVSPDPKASQAYSAYLAEQLPVMWLPNPVYQISVVANGLNIGTQDPAGSFMPQRWSWAS